MEVGGGLNLAVFRGVLLTLLSFLSSLLKPGAVRTQGIASFGKGTCVDSAVL